MYLSQIAGTLKIGPAVETIGSEAFYWSQLCNLDLSEATSLLEIHAAAFYYSRLAGTLVFPASLETIGTQAFYGSRSVTGLDFSEAASLKRVEWKAFDETGLSYATEDFYWVKPTPIFFPMGVTLELPVTPINVAYDCQDGTSPSELEESACRANPSGGCWSF